MDMSSARVVTDLQGLQGLKRQARTDQAGAIDEVARQFEGLFVQMALKSMRQASLGDGLLDSQQSLFYRDMYDQQLAVEMSSGQGIGLAEVIRRQLGGDSADTAPAAGQGMTDYRQQPVMRAQAAPTAGAAATGRFGVSAASPLELDGTPEDFVNKLGPFAQRAAAELGVPAEAILAQAALETGWGRHVMDGPDGSSHNLFGIKADARWDGERASQNTLEFMDGVPLRTRADFRSYGSYAESFADYAAFIKGNPRYGEALKAGDDAGRYVDELQRAGYATDPAYARKIRQIMERPEFRMAQDGAAQLAVNQAPADGKPSANGEPQRG